MTHRSDSSVCPSKFRGRGCHLPLFHTGAHETWGGHQWWEYRKDPSPSAPSDMELPERLAWRQGYRQAIVDLLEMERTGGEVSINGRVIHRRIDDLDYTGVEGMSESPGF